ncbi:zinc ABC transporter substrate-binding protein [Heliobacterium chlorum]|uniref:Zinc ABC transporter substrate-binding protein n=1 Tax=Heliobacterium chlorum TaxID=2698 RepID=A0ABR7T5T9_HELCL|nr:metal ABC transporter substrate-binding protein [Heliobacterium chlorum]MBC9785021.1 zinc ABC transporter substrate-binding protein [Heliobacterium chlorum]
MIPKALKGLLIGLLSAVVISGCSSNQDDKKSVSTQDHKIQVVSSFYPMYEFTQQVGGEKVEVTNLVPPGAEPHDWEPSPQDMVKVSKARMLIYNGGGFEGWIEKVSQASNNPNLVLVDTSKGIEMLPGENSDDGDHEASHQHGKNDPHFWLDPNLVKIQVENIKRALVDLDPDNKDYYEANAKAYQDKLDRLDGEFKEIVSKAPSKELITTHSAFSYLAHRYGLHQVSIMGISPDAEPKPAELARIAAYAREHKVKYIFFETLVSPKVGEALAREVKADTLVLNPIEGLTEDEQKQGLDYITVMKQNLENLKKALGYNP